MVELCLKFAGFPPRVHSRLARTIVSSDCGSGVNQDRSWEIAPGRLYLAPEPMRVTSNRAHRETVILAGLDIGSTTTSLLAASARIAMNCASGRLEISGADSGADIVCRPDPVFTPFEGEMISTGALRWQIETWLRDAGISPDDIFSSGALVTGLAAQSQNASAITDLVHELLGESVVATADDPKLESWLAFMGSAASLSRARSGETILNLDIGGGTANSALGLNGNVLATGCHFIGARHLRFEPGSYRLTGLSRYGCSVLNELRIKAKAGDTLELSDVEHAADYFVDLLEALVSGDRTLFCSGAGRLIEQVALSHNVPTQTIVTFSGGVGELIYAAAEGKPMPPVTHFGDHGIDLARAILKSPRLCRDVTSVVPENKGRATVQGLTLHSVEISGTTLFLPHSDRLPLRDLPIVASLPSTASAAEISAALELGGKSARGICLQIDFDAVNPALEAVRSFGQQLSGALSESAAANAGPIVILTTANAGKALGNYATDWQQRHHNLIVIDEITLRAAEFVSIGRARHGLVPVTFYGIK